MSIRGADLLSLKSMTRDEIEAILATADRMDPRKRTDLLRDYILATLFFEPSTRTRLGFESAMHRLGGAVIGFASGAQARAGGGLYAENLEDTVHMIEGFADAVVIRHPMEGAAMVAAENTKVPVINAGDGFYETSEHPTQSLSDLYTISRIKGGLDGLTIGIFGNAKYIRALHSTAYGLSNFDVKIIFVGPSEFPLPEPIRERLRERKVTFVETDNLDDTIPELDVLYTESLPHRDWSGLSLWETTRMVEYAARYRITLERLANAKPDLMVTHTAPRSDQMGFQIYPEVDATPYAKYFEQAANLVRVRMAVLAMILGDI